VIDHRRERARLARPGRADDQYEPAFLHHEVLETHRHAQLLDRRDVDLDVAYDHAAGAALLEHVDAEAADPFLDQREIDFHVALEDRDLVFAHRLVGDFLHRRRVEHVAVHRYELALDLDLDRRAGGEEDVRGLCVGHQLE
jgi:hypothetical protein